MKKLFLLFVIVFLMGTYMFGAYNVISPRTNEKWNKFDIHPIKWMTLGDRTKRVNIFLYDKTGKNKIMDIAKNVKNSGEYYCTFNLFRNIPDDKYIIVITSKTGKILGKSKLVLITDKNTDRKIVPPVKNKIKIKSPALKINVKHGRTLNIQWESREKLSMNFIIELYKPDKITKVKRIAVLKQPLMEFNVKPILKKNFNYSWVVSQDIPSGKYYIKISIPNKGVFSFSPVILVKSKKFDNLRIKHNERRR